MLATAVSLIALGYAQDPVRTYPGAPLYSPDPSIELKGHRRTSSEHDEIYRKTKFPYILDIKQGKGQLKFIGVQHIYEPNHPQLKRLEEIWTEMRPDIALVESRVTDYSGKYEEAAKRGEPYFVLVMARKSNVDVYSLEPDPRMEATALAKAESPERALLFLTLRRYFSQKRTAKTPIPDPMIQFILTRRAKEFGLECSLKTIADMDAMWKKDFPESANWREIDERVTWPGAERTYLNRLSNVSNSVRDEHWAKTMVDLVRKGKKVFAVGGASHTINLEPVLRETLKGNR